MTIIRILALGIMLMMTVGIAAFDDAYAANPCCQWVGGKYINLKTGKVVTPPKGAHAPPGPVGGTKPGSPCCELRTNAGGEGGAGGAGVHR